MEEYQEFRDSMEVLEKFIEKTETKEIDGEVHITIDDNNVEEFKEIMENLISIASSDDGYVDEILEYLSEIDKKITDRNMIAKFIPLFAAIDCLARATQIPNVTDEVKIDDWVFELHYMDDPNGVPPLDARIGKVVNIIPSEDDPSKIIYKVKTPMSNEITEWEDASFVIIHNMEATLKKYNEKYVKTF
jgi:hypothetical protein